MYTSMIEPAPRRRHIVSTRTTDAMRDALRAAAAEETNGDLSALVRHAVLDWFAARMTKGITDETAHV
jgi:hypothetical protein